MKKADVSRHVITLAHEHADEDLGLLSELLQEDGTPYEANGKMSALY